MEELFAVNMITVLFIWAVFAAIGYYIGKSKGRPTAGAILGFLLGPLGWLLVFVGPDNSPKCPECGGTVVEGARLCKNCGSELNLGGGVMDVDDMDFSGAGSGFKKDI